MPSAQQRSVLDAAREHGSITLDELMNAATKSVVDPMVATDLARELGLDVIDREGEAWADVERLADNGPAAFAADRDATLGRDTGLDAEAPATLYLREIGRAPLLSAEEEVRLAKQIEAGREARTRLEQLTGDGTERARLEEQKRLGDLARHRMVESNLRLVVSIARKFLGRGVAFLDLVQEGNIGLQRGVDGYDWRRGFRFSTYAYWWIRQAIGRAVATHGRTIRLPSHIIEQLSRFYTAARELQRDLGRAPTVAEIGKALDVEPEKVRAALQAARVPLSLDSPVGTDGEATLASFVADTVLRSPAEAAEDADVSAVVETALREHLTPREVAILKLRYGLADSRERSIAEVAREVGLSRESVRLIEVNALRKLRTSSFRERFDQYV